MRDKVAEKNSNIWEKIMGKGLEGIELKNTEVLNNDKAKKHN